MFNRIARFGIGTLLAISVFAGQAQAGGSNAELRCVSKNQKVTVSGSIPGDFAEFRLAFRENSATMTMTDGPEKERGDRIFVLEDFKRGVFSVAVALPEGLEFKLYGIPQSVRKAGKRTTKRFQAILLTAPRPSLRAWNDANAYFHQLPMSCSHKYEL